MKTRVSQEILNELASDESSELASDESNEFASDESAKEIEYPPESEWEEWPLGVEQEWGGHTWVRMDDGVHYVIPTEWVFSDDARDKSLER